MQGYICYWYSCNTSRFSVFEFDLWEHVRLVQPVPLNNRKKRRKKKKKGFWWNVQFSHTCCPRSWRHNLGQNGSAQGLVCAKFKLHFLANKTMTRRNAAVSVCFVAFLSSMDCCNSCLWDMKKLPRLQRVPNTAAWTVTQRKRWDHVTPTLHELHWLPVEINIQYKILSLAYSCMNGTAQPPPPPHTFRN